MMEEPHDEKSRQSTSGPRYMLAIEQIYEICVQVFMGIIGSNA